MNPCKSDFLLLPSYCKTCQNKSFISLLSGSMNSLLCSTASVGNMSPLESSKFTHSFLPVVACRQRLPSFYLLESGRLCISNHGKTGTAIGAAIGKVDYKNRGIASAGIQALFSLTLLLAIGTREQTASKWELQTEMSCNALRGKGLTTVHC